MKIHSSSRSTPAPDSVAKMGDRGARIRKIEAQLEKLGYDVGAVDGRFDDDTFAAVKAFKRGERKIDNEVGRLGARGQRLLQEQVARTESTTVRATAFNWPPRYEGGGHAADEALFDQVAAKSDVMGFSEFQWARKIRDGEKDWGFFHPNPANDGEKRRTGQVVMWRKDKFSLVDSGTTLMNKPTRVQEAGAGPSVHPGKSIVWTKLRNKQTGEIWTVAAAHFVASKHLGGASEALWKKQRDAVAEWMKKQGPRTILMGDFNGQWKEAISRPLHKVADVQAAPSHGGRAIDWILRSKDLDAVGKTDVLRSNGQSDHRPVRGTVRG